MAPRRTGRPSKGPTGGTRRDAALDAMRRYGFPDNLIKTTIKELLQVYGDDGWPFLEEDAYRILLDAILEKVEKEPLAIAASSQGDEQGPGGNGTDASAAGPTNAALAYSDTVVPAAETSSVVPVCSNLKDHSLGGNATDASAETHRPSSVIPPCSSIDVMEAAVPGIEVQQRATDSHMPLELIDEPVCIYSLPAPEGESSGSDMDLGEDIWEVQTDVAKGNDSVEQTSNSCQSPPRVAFPQVQANSRPRPKHRPCYGWIDDDDELDLVELAPSPMAEEFRRSLCRRDVSQKSKSRWHVSPEGV